MNTLKSKKWWLAAGTRAIKTMAQSALAMIPVSAMITEVNWIAVLSTAALAGVISILTSLNGLPEVKDESKEELSNGKDEDDE
jgi:hypothetical protein